MKIGAEPVNPREHQPPKGRQRVAPVRRAVWAQLVRLDCSQVLGKDKEKPFPYAVGVRAAKRSAYKNDFCQPVTKMLVFRPQN
jgi:hypothetical protein